MICNKSSTNSCSETSNFINAFGIELEKVDRENVTSNKNKSSPFEYLTASRFSVGSSKTKSTLESESAKFHKKGSDTSSSTSQDKTSNHIATWKIGDFRGNSRQTIFPNVKDKIPPTDKEIATISCSTGCYSKGSFFTNSQRGNRNVVEVKDDLPEFSNPLRLFNKSGKPLTDQKGRPLLNIFGEQLVIFDEKGKPVSDLKGNQVFNSLGESAIYPTTNLYVSPSEEEPGIPLLDIGKDNILFVYDNTGHPLTDSFGRPLLNASGNPMINMRVKGIVDVSDHDDYRLKKIYSKKPFENFIRHVQIFDSSGKPLTDDCGKVLEGSKIICNKSGMPMCDIKNCPLYFKYGSKIPLAKRENKNIKGEAVGKSELRMTQTSDDSLSKQLFMSKDLTELGKYENEEENRKIVFDEGLASDGLMNNLDKNGDLNSVIFKKSLSNNNSKTTHSSNEGNESLGDHCSYYFNENGNNISKGIENTPSKLEDHNTESLLTENGLADGQQLTIDQSGIFVSIESRNLPENKSTEELGHGINYNGSSETIFLFNANEKIDKSSSVNVTHFEAIRGKQLYHQRKPSRKMYSFNLFQFFKDSFLKPSEKLSVDPYEYNEYGKPIKDIHGNLLYDRYGIPMTGARGRRLSEKARRALRFKLRNVPKKRTNIASENIFLPLSRNESHDQFGEPIYDKYGRPLYDLTGMLIYDRFGRPLTDAFGRPLVDAIGQPLMDCEGRVLTSVYDSDSNTNLVDIFGRKIYDKRGRMLFDSYGRPKYDIFTNAIYDSCGRPATDANGGTLFDFLNKPIQPFPEKPLHKNTRSHLPKHIETILAVPSMYRLLKYSQPLVDVFGGPLFDDLGRPLYNKIGKPLYDRYGRPLYKSDGTPLCDCYGRPLSEDIREADDDQTLTVVDCLKLLKVTEEYSKWMVGKNKTFKPTESEVSKKRVVAEVSYKKRSDKRSGQYVYTLTRVTKFASGRQALEILEAPLSPATVAEMHRLPVDNKPIVMVVGQRHRKTVKK